MKKATKWPKESEVSKMREKLSSGPATRILDFDNLTRADQVKFRICEQIIKFKNEHKLTQKELAERLGENEALISKVVRYRFDEFTIDRLLKFVTVLYPKIEFKLKVAS